MTSDREQQHGTPVVYGPVTTPPVKDATALLVHSLSGVLEAADERDPRGCSVPMLVLLSLPRMAINMAWAAQWAGLGPYLGTLLPPYAVQLTQVIGPLSGILVAPTVGVLSDRSTNRWGRRRPLLLFGAVSSALCWTLMGFTRELGALLGDDDAGDGARFWTSLLTVVLYTWMDVTVNLVQTPAILLIADFAGDRQTLGAGIGQASSTLGSILIAGYIYCFGAAHLTLRWFLAMLSATMLATVGLVCAFAHEAPRAKSAHDDLRTKSRRIASAFAAIARGLRTLPRVLVVFCVVFFAVQYGFTAYNGSKGQFFGVEVFDGDAHNAGACRDACSPAQRRYNEGVQLAGGLADMAFNVVGYLYSWLLPLVVGRLGARWTMTLGAVPQTLLMAMAFSQCVPLNVAIVALTAVTQATSFALIVPLLIHVFGDGADVGMYVGAVNSANCLGQLLNFVASAALVETALGYRLPVFVGGVVSFLGVVTSVLFFKVKMHSM
ncbi:hypothetical protein PybrP1_006126 [[Pythium] brassicae (nom. inval.)]|nr:hypothetical protein PybrP1_006126 [[Pythium] brassicae (nom. inval.)]